MASRGETEDRIEKVRITVSTPSERFTYWLSQIANPFVVGLGVLGYIALATAPTPMEGVQWLAVIGVGLAIPYGIIWWGVIRGTWTDLHVSRRSQRIIPFLIGLVALATMLAGLIELAASRPLVATLAAIIVEFVMVTLITQMARLKISLHLDAAAGAVTVVSWLASPVMLVLTPLVVVLAWARWKVAAHTPLQTLSGALLAITVTATTFWLFGIH